PASGRLRKRSTIRRSLRAAPSRSSTRPTAACASPEAASVSNTAAVVSTAWRRRSARTPTRCSVRSATMRTRLPRCISGKWCEERRSLDPEIGVAYHLAPLLDLQLDSRGPFVGRVGDRLEAERRKLLPHVRPRHAFRDLARQ